MTVNWWNDCKPWVDAYNALPDMDRKIGQAMEIKVRLQHLDFERDRLKSAYDRSLADIRAHEKNLLRSLDDLGDPPVSGSE